jgi:ABC-2 type transport system ATP-binding protein
MIEISQLSRKFGDNYAVKDLTLSIPGGAMYGFLGPNGAGKTTTLRMLMGLLQPTMGTAKIDGNDVTKDPVKVKSIVGYLPDEIFLYDYLTGRQFLEFVADIHRIDAKLRDKKIDHLLELFSLSEASNDFTANYSFGMKKKIALAGIVIHDPKVLILDEPFNGLDPQAIRDFRILLDKMVRNGTTVIFSSHVLEVVEKLVTHVGIISNGELRISDSIEAITENHQSLEKAFFKLTGNEENSA